MTKYKTVNLGELFPDKQEQTELTEMINKRNSKKLREWLNEDKRKNRLYNVGMLSDYLYYNLCYQFQMQTV